MLWGLIPLGVNGRFDNAYREALCSVGATKPSREYVDQKLLIGQRCLGGFFYMDPREGYFKFVTALGKGRRTKDTKTRQRPKPFDLIPPLMEVIKPLMDKPGEFVFYTPAGRAYTTTRLERIWKVANTKASKEFGIRKINLYNGLKHTFVHNRLDEGYDLDEVQAVCRHTSPEMTRAYGDYSKGRLGKVMMGDSVAPPLHREENQENLNNSKEKWSGREDLNHCPHAPNCPVFQHLQTKNPVHTQFTPFEKPLRMIRVDEESEETKC